MPPTTKHTILFPAVNPAGTDPRALDREARAIHVELECSGFGDHFELVTRWVAEPLDLLREVRKLGPTAGRPADIYCFDSAATVAKIPRAISERSVAARAA